MKAEHVRSADAKEAAKRVEPKPYCFNTIGRDNLKQKPKERYHDKDYCPSFKAVYPEEIKYTIRRE